MLRLSLKTLYKALGSKRYFDARLEALQILDFGGDRPFGGPGCERVARR